MAIVEGVLFPVSGVLFFCFFELILYWASFLKLFISCMGSLVEFSGLMLSSVNRDTLTSSFLVYIVLIFCCLPVPAGNSSMILNR